MSDKKEQPTCIALKGCATVWILDVKFHREDGPAIEWISGTKEWFFEEKRYREDGPAIEYPRGLKNGTLMEKKLQN